MFVRLLTFYFMLESVKILGCRSGHSISCQIHNASRCPGVALSGGGGLAELLEVDLTITVGVSKGHHLSDDVVGDFLTEALQESSELVLGDDTVTIGIDSGESLLKFGLLLRREFGHIFE